jgi:hypothetical protein
VAGACYTKADAPSSVKLVLNPTAHPVRPIHQISRTWRFLMGLSIAMVLLPTPALSINALLIQ